MTEEQLSEFNDLIVAVYEAIEEGIPAQSAQEELKTWMLHHASELIAVASFAVSARAALSAEPVDDRIGKWLSAALEDSSTCAEMRADIEAWFASRAAKET